MAHSGSHALMHPLNPIRLFMFLSYVSFLTSMPVVRPVRGSSYIPISPLLAMRPVLYVIRSLRSLKTPSPLWNCLEYVTATRDGCFRMSNMRVEERICAAESDVQMETSCDTSQNPKVEVKRDRRRSAKGSATRLVEKDDEVERMDGRKTHGGGQVQCHRSCNSSISPIQAPFV